MNSKTVKTVIALVSIASSACCPNPHNLDYSKMQRSAPMNTEAQIQRLIRDNMPPVNRVPNCTTRAVSDARCAYENGRA